MVQRRRSHSTSVGQPAKVRRSGAAGRGDWAGALLAAQLSQNGGDAGAAGFFVPLGAGPPVAPEGHRLAPAHAEELFEGRAVPPERSGRVGGWGSAGWVGGRATGEKRAFGEKIGRLRRSYPMAAITHESAKWNFRSVFFVGRHAVARSREERTSRELEPRSNQFPMPSSTSDIPAEKPHSPAFGRRQRLFRRAFGPSPGQFSRFPGKIHPPRLRSRWARLPNLAPRPCPDSAAGGGGNGHFLRHRPHQEPKTKIKHPAATLGGHQPTAPGSGFPLADPDLAAETVFGGT
jgi:hypothetical protein